MFFNNFIDIYLATFFMLFAIGPICITVINYNITKGFKAGFSAGMGVVLADICYIFAGSFFIDFLSGILSNFYIKIFSVLMALFLFYIAYSFFNKSKEKETNDKYEKKYLSIFFKLFILTISGPTTMFTYSAIFTGFIGKNFDKKLMIISASFATFSFYFLLNIILFFIRKKLPSKVILLLNKISAVIISCFALLILFKNLK